MRDKVIRQRKKKPTEKECYAELARAVRIYCYQAIVREELGFFRFWLGNIQRAELKAVLENAEKSGGLRSRPRKPRTQEKPEKQAK